MGRPPESEMPLGDVYPSLPHREAREKELLAAYNQLAGEEAKEVKNALHFCMAMSRCSSTDCRTVSSVFVFRLRELERFVQV
jgi:hypothetical protein